jgi:hypothetical protein
MNTHPPKNSAEHKAWTRAACEAFRRPVPVTEEETADAMHVFAPWAEHPRRHSTV